INADGSCSIRGESLRDLVVPYNGTWDGANGTITILGVDDKGGAFTLPGSFTASAVPASLLPTRVSGSLNGQGDRGDSVQVSFGCNGEPSCSGQYQSSGRSHDCSNGWSVSDAMAISGLDLSRAGPLTLDALFKRIESDSQRNAN